MASVTAESTNGSDVVIAISGNFDFNVVQDFQQAYKEQESKAENFTVDLRQVEYMDSSALGMLLNMRKHLQAESKEIRISNCRPQIRRILEISRFDKKFTLD